MARPLTMLAILVLLVGWVALIEAARSRRPNTSSFSLIVLELVGVLGLGTLLFSPQSESCELK